jgi:hypothetical protein
MRNVSTKSLEKIKTKCMFNIPTNPSVYEIMWKNMVEKDRP